MVAAKTELARQLTLIGDLDSAEKELNHAARVVLVSGNRRQKITVKHRLAYTNFLKGNPPEALRLLTEAEQELDPKFDLHHQLMIEGLRLKILKDKNDPGLSAAEQKVSAAAGGLPAVPRRAGGLVRHLSVREPRPVRRNPLLN